MISDCVISDNGGRGLRLRDTNATVSSCTITGNCGGISGGGGLSLSILSESIILDNNPYGGVYWSSAGGLAISNCVIAGNSGSHAAGGLHCGWETPFTVVNCTITQNSSLNEAGGLAYDASGTVSNSIIWGNSDPEIASRSDQAPAIQVSYSDVEGGYPGLANINANPRFVESGRWDANGTPYYPHDDFWVEGEYRLRQSSPCIDAGTNEPPGGLPATDIEAKTRPVDGDGDGMAVADMGAYEYLHLEPSIDLSSSSFTFSHIRGEPEPELQSFLISNRGGGIMDWQILGDCNWLRVSPRTGACATEDSVVTLAVEPGRLCSGYYSCMLRLVAPNAVNSPVLISVGLHIGDMLRVPEQYATIQDAIDAASDGDLVMVAPGRYKGRRNRDIDFLGKEITVRSAAGPESCIIDCEIGQITSRRGFHFRHGEDCNSVLEGFSITNGDAEFGGAIYCERSSPTISNCRIVRNRAQFGGGVACRDSSPRITNCLVAGNMADRCSPEDEPWGRWGKGGGIFCEGGMPTISKSVVAENTSATIGAGVFCHGAHLRIIDSTISSNTGKRIAGFGNGGGIFLEEGLLVAIGCLILDNSTNYRGGGISIFGDNVYARIENCVVSGNRAWKGGGIYSGGHNQPMVTNCTITRNRASFGGGLYSQYKEGIVATNCIVWGNSGTTNTDTDPCFAFATDYHLMAGSPCIDTGTNMPFMGLAACDIDGTPRPLDGIGDGVSIADIGAHEYNRTKPCIAVSSIFFAFKLEHPQSTIETLMIRNCGTGVLNWRIVCDCDWVTLVPTSGASVGETDTVAIKVQSNSLPPGYHSCRLEIFDPNAVNSPEIVTVLLYVPYNLHVPADYSTIQAAVDASYDYDTVVLAPGTHTGPGNHRVQLRAKPITVRSINPNNPAVVAATVVDCNREGVGFVIADCDANSVLDGVTITNGDSGWWRSTGGVEVRFGSATIRNCVISESRYGGIGSFDASPELTNCVISGNLGGGIIVRAGWPVVTNCLIKDNYAGSGIFCEGCLDSSLLVRNCQISGNRAFCPSPRQMGPDYICTCEEIRYFPCGGGICLFGWKGGTLKVDNCTITGNMARKGGGIWYYSSGDWYLTPPSITNCILSSNIASIGPELYFTGQWGNGSCLVSYTDLKGGLQNVYVNAGFTLDWGPGNIDADPCFLEPGSWDANSTPDDANDDFWVEGDYHLLPHSPCINAGDPNYVVSVEETDIDGQPRVFDGRIDMGADEFVPRVQCEMEFRPRALNLRSKGKYVKAHLLLPEGFAADDVDTGSPAVIEPLGIESERIKVVGGEQNRVEVSAVFARKVFCGQGNFDGSVSVEGLLKNGQTFYGTDQIKIIDRSSGQIAALARCWLRSDCRPPDWCDGLDINGDSVVNFADFAGLNTCCIEAGVQ